MPTENRSSNTEMVSVPRFSLEAARDCLVICQDQAFQSCECESCPQCGLMPDECTGTECSKTCQCTTCEHCMNKDSIDSLTTLLARPVPQPHPEPIAWMVGTAFWWTKEEAERDAAETGKTITPIGPMSGIAPAEEHQGEPVALPERKDPTQQWHIVGGVAKAEGWNACLDEIAKLGPLYLHADPGEVERLRENHRKHAARLIDERGQLRAQLVERDALLESAAEGASILRSLIENIEAKGNYSPESTASFLQQALHCVSPALSPSASAEPSAPKCTYCGDTGQIMVGRSGDANDGNAPIMEPCEDCEPVRGSGSLEFDKLLAEYHAIVWASGEDGDVDYDLAGIDTAKKLQALHRAALERKPS